MFAYYAVGPQINITKDLKGRIARHNSVIHDGWTKRHQPWDLYWSMELTSRSSAMQLEKYLKKKPREYLKRLMCLVVKSSLT